MALSDKIPSRNQRLSVALVAGEHSGDMLGADLISVLKRQHPAIRCFGVGGALMQQEGLESVYPMDKLTAIGFTEALLKLPSLLLTRCWLAKYLIKQKPDLFISIDAPDFNLGLAKRLKQAGIKTIHYVSPTIWAWRKDRIHQIKRATDLVLCLYPFEPAIYQKHQHPALFVGHPLAHAITLKDHEVQDMQDKNAARIELGVKHNAKHSGDSLNTKADSPILALLPGSRATEIKHLGKLFFQVAYSCWQQNRQLGFVVSAANPSCFAKLEALRKDPVFNQMPIKIFTGQSQTLLRASDVVLVASGTATLETMLIKRPMTVAYKLNYLNYLLLRWLVKIPFMAQPNWLAGRAIVPEFLQNQATVENLSTSVMHNLSILGTKEEKDLMQVYHRIHQQLSAANLAEAVKACLVTLL